MGLRTFRTRRPARGLGAWMIGRQEHSLLPSGAQIVKHGAERPSSCCTSSRLSFYATIYSLTTGRSTPEGRLDGMAMDPASQAAARKNVWLGISDRQRLCHVTTGNPASVD